MKKTSILITGAGGGGVGEQIFKALRMAKTPYRIVAIDILPVSKSLYEADAHYLAPKAEATNYLKKLLDICKKEDINILIPGSEPELKKISTSRHLFVQNGVLPLINDHQVITLCMDKWKTYNFLRNNGLNPPQSVLIKKEEALNQIKNFPVVIKPIGAGGSVNTFIAQDTDELKFFAKYILRNEAIPLVQEYMGSYNEEYTVGVLTSFDGELMGSIALKRQILSGLSNRIRVLNRWKDKCKDEILAISSGVSQGTIDDYPDVRKYAEDIALKLNSKGPLNVQCRKTETGVSAFEINPRFSGTSSIRAMVGFNGIDILIRKEYFKEKVDLPISYKKGIVTRGLEEKFVSFDDGTIDYISELLLNK